MPAEIDQLCAEHDLKLSLLVRAGSKSYGIDVATSDDDFLGVFVPSLRRTIGLRGIEQDTYAGNKPDFTLHEIGKFCHLALKGNPAILETLWNPDVLASDEWGRKLLAIRSRCLHRGSLEVYLAYADSQMRKMVKQKGLHTKGGTYNGKFGAHLIRLLHSGIALARNGEVVVRVAPPLAATLLKIRGGELSMAEVLAMAEPLLVDLQKAATTNTLPEKPDEAAFNDLVIAARLSRNP